MKRVKLLSIITMLLMFSFPTIAYASEDMNGDLSLEEGAEEYVESEADRILREQKEAALNNAPGINARASSYTKLNMTVFEQENGYYCGPATVKNVVHYIMGTSQSQSYYANKLGTTTSGTNMTNIPGVVNEAIGENYYVYDPIASRTEWDTELPKSLVYDRPAILDINTTEVAAFPYNTTGHFVCLSGEDAITSDGDGYYFRIADPVRGDSGHKWYTKDDLYQANINHFRQAYIW